MPRQKIEKLLHVGLYRPHADIIIAAENAGFNISEQIRHLIMEWGEKRFAPEKGYSKAMATNAQIREAKMAAELKMQTMTNEQYAEEVLRGKVRDGLKVGFRVANGQEMYIPLAEIKQHTVENNGLVKVHNSLLDKTFLYPNGQAPTELQYAQIFKGWDNE